MIPAAILTALADAGATIRVDGEHLKLSAEAPAELIPEIRRRKRVLMVHLQAGDEEWFAQLQGRLNNGARLLWALEPGQMGTKEYAVALYLFQCLLLDYEYAGRVRLEAAKAMAA